MLSENFEALRLRVQLKLLSHIRSTPQSIRIKNYNNSIMKGVTNHNKGLAVILGEKKHMFCFVPVETEPCTLLPSNVIPFELIAVKVCL